MVRNRDQKYLNIYFFFYNISKVIVFFFKINKERHLIHKICFSQKFHVISYVLVLLTVLAFGF